MSLLQKQALKQERKEAEMVETQRGLVMLSDNLRFGKKTFEVNEQKKLEFQGGGKATGGRAGECQDVVGYGVEGGPNVKPGKRFVKKATRS